MKLRVCLSVQLRAQKVGDASNMKHMLREVSGSEWSNTNSQPMRSATRKAIEMGPPKPFGIHILSLPILDARLGMTGFNILLLSCVLLLCHSFLFSSSSTLEWECAFCVIAWKKYLTF